MMRRSFTSKSPILSNTKPKKAFHYRKPMKNVTAISAFFSSAARPLISTRSPQLPVLDASVKYALAQQKAISLTDTAVIYIHHALFSSLSLLHSMFQLGLAPENTFVLGKHYSESKLVIEEAKKMNVYYQPCSGQVGLGRFTYGFVRDVSWLWSNVISNLKNKNVKNLIIMDIGGHALTFIPAEILEKYNVVGIEKTTAGLINPNAQGLTFPIIEPASCAAKRILESPLIAEAAVTKLAPLIPIRDESVTCGVLGYGAIGKAVVDRLLSMGHKVAVYDSDPNQLKKVTGGAIPAHDNLSVIAFADYLFGCSGKISIPSVASLSLCNKDKVCISVSSEDIEFLPILQFVQHIKNGKVASKPLNDVTYETGMGAKIRILRGGFPINFDDTGESVPAKDIDLTRSLVFMSVLQAAEFLGKPDILAKGGSYMLHPGLQKFVATEWLKRQSSSRFSSDTASKFQDERWIADHSGGIHALTNNFTDTPIKETPKDSISHPGMR